MHPVTKTTTALLTAALLTAGCGGETGTGFTSSSSTSGSGAASSTGSGGTGGDGGSGAGTTSSSTTTGPACTSAAMCPDPGTSCLAPTCTDGACGTTATPIGTGCTDGGGKVCDGMGSCVECFDASTCPGADTDCVTRTCNSGKCGFFYTLSGTPTATQVPGDCKKTRCDGVGGIQAENDDTDVPEDGNDCTTGACSNGAPSTTPLATGTPCTSGGGHLCQTGTCVKYIPVKCKVGSMVYQGCDGFTHPGLSMTIIQQDQSIGNCNGIPSDFGYCPPGNTCAISLNGMATLGTCQ
jgi:hypothetical protein